MVREELIASAVQFLQDPSVASSSSDKKVAFLKSKNLTKDEIDVAFMRMNQEPPPPNAGGGPGGVQPQSNPSPAASYGYGYGYNSYPPPWAAPPPPPPRRDWRDWFIMATVTSGVGYGLYTAAKRYVVPLIAPPTPPQIEQDKAAIDEEFNKAFLLIDQLSSDTAALKTAEAERTEKLDNALKEVDAVVAEMKAANSRRDAENRAVAEQVRDMKSLVPKALEGWKANGDAKLEDLAQEMSSLKKLLENRTGRSAGASTPNSTSYSVPTVNGRTGPYAENEAAPSQSQGSSVGAETSPAPNGKGRSSKEESPPKKSGPSTDRKAAIPAWQMAAANKNAEAS